MARTIQLSALGSRINKNGYVLHMLTLGCRTLCSQLLNFADLEQSLLNVVFKSGALLAAAVVEALPAHKVHIRAMPPSQEAMPFIVLSDSTSSTSCGWMALESLMELRRWIVTRFARLLSARALLW